MLLQQTKLQSYNNKQQINTDWKDSFPLVSDPTLAKYILEYYLGKIKFNLDITKPSKIK